MEYARPANRLINAQEIDKEKKYVGVQKVRSREKPKIDKAIDLASKTTWILSTQNSQMRRKS